MSREETAERAPASPPLDVVQRWFQSVITHPGGVAGGMGSEAAQAHLSLAPGELDRVVRPSRHLSSEERLSIYAYAYYARLLECLGDGFPVLRNALGEDVFASFAAEYLERYPSRSYTLDRLGESFPRFLEETRPDRPPEAEAAGAAVLEINWPDFLIDLARLEWAIAKVFDGPGVEGETLLRHEDLQALGPEGFAAARLEPVPCLRLLSFRYPVNAYYTAARRIPEGEPPPPPPDPAPQHVALTRTDFVVRRFALSPPEHALLAALVAGAPVGEALAAAATESDLPDEELAALLRGAFSTFAAAGFFRAITPSGATLPSTAP